MREWLEGDPASPPPPASRLAPEPAGRNSSWGHLARADVISMPDEWEYPWLASWDLAFHRTALAHRSGRLRGSRPFRRRVSGCFIHM